ncbi:MAG: ABC transporter substrate-binding protein, partial [Pseudorhodoplanes sp.]
DNPSAVAGVVRGIVKTQKALKADVSLATKVGKKLFPEYEASLIADLIQRDLPYYDATVSREFVDGMTEFQRNVGLIKGHPKYEDVVATQFSQYWT